MKQLIYHPTRKDVAYCFDVAKFRVDINRKLGWEKSDHNDVIITHFIGACGELAVSNIFGIEWDGAKLDMLDYQEWRKTKADLGCFEVKTINHHRGNLTLRDNDKDWATALLVLAPGSRDAGVALASGKQTGLQPIKIVAHIPVNQGKEIGTKYVNNGKTRYVVLRDKLRNADELHKTLAGFDKLRKQRQVIPFKGGEFRLSKWVT